MPKTKEFLSVDGRDVPVSNLDKVMFPDGHVTKADVINYYLGVSEYLLPHLKNRPLTLKRYPNGAPGEFFYEKDAPSFTPEWVRTFPVPRRESKRKINYVLVDDRPTLAWLANLANLEIHPFLHRVPEINQPTSIVFDLDPGNGADVVTCARVALLLRDLLANFKLKSFPKVSGSKGLQVHVPLNTDVGYEVTQPFAKAVARILSEQHPKLIVAEMTKSLRTRKVFIDWSQNSDFKTTVAVYSLRAKVATAFVSLPVTWEELETAIERKNAAALFFTIASARDRLKRDGDLFKPVLNLKQRLPDAVSKQLKGETPVSLKTYRRKRDFSKTEEPAPAPVRSREGSRRQFVIQKHAASHLHYDFRLEMHDVLKSWAVPKGPPYALDEKRLAMPTEDHPMGYLKFEGVIPKGQYGGGTVMVWDIGTYELLEGDYHKGYLHIQLKGAKLKGEWKLMRKRKEGEREMWFLGKSGKSMRKISRQRDDSSAISGRSMQQIAQSADATWQSNRRVA